MERTAATSKPIGYWLKHLDALLERQFDAVLADLGLTRRHWQVLHTLRSGARTRDDLTATLAPFWTDGEPNLHAVLDGPDGLTARGCIRTAAASSGTQDTFTLTDEGRTTHDTAFERVIASRALLLKDLTPEQYAATVANLQQMAHNVESALAAARAVH